MEVLQLNKNKVISNILELDPKECKILLYLSASADENDMIDVVPSKVVSKTGVSKSSLLSILKSLREKGFIKIELPLNNGRGYKYRICMDDEDIKKELFEIQERLF